MRYALLAYTSADAWARLSSEEHAAWWVDGAALAAELADRAVLVSQVGLATAAGTTVTVRGGEARTVAASAPVPPAALVGVLVIDVPDLAAALDVASRSPAARTGGVEVRPVA